MSTSTTPAAPPPPRRRARRPLAATTAVALTAGVVSALGLGATSAAAASDAQIEAVPVTTVDGGRTATVALRLLRSSSKPTTVRWTTAGGTARTGTDYAPTSGTVTFPAKAKAGTVRTVKVPTKATKHAAASRTIAVRVTPSGATLKGAQPTVVVNAQHMPYLDASLPVQQRVKDLLKRMTLEEKVGQMTQAERNGLDANREQISAYKLGSILSGGGSTPATNDAKSWADMVDAYQSYALKTRLQIPMIYGVDSVHGHGNLVGATIFPHNIGLGSTRDPQAWSRTRKPSWPARPGPPASRGPSRPASASPATTAGAARTSRSARTPRSSSPWRRRSTACRAPRGRRLADNDKVLASAKHFAGDGDTTYGSGRNDAGANSSDYPIDQGITQQSRKHFNQIDLSPYKPAVQQHDVGTIMPSYSSVDYTDDGLGNPVKMHANKEPDAGLAQGQDRLRRLRHQRLQRHRQGAR
ncbi:hypothetical protein GCM10025868_43970 [Angustibacter aerolatus]|uniref:beta-glucosidase n=1 Tax=Angustibacter aerolatus TaxID=1162965 RepID=A0ABQ6JQQ0_9ACTN|nr:glycoside hydrolase family 3 N-terminal domain-containing protein [Angustibacter aerolatus]GMA89147.1 hypothetical protein GCM10025868_43970 [Angustibacter aerolatus]